MAGLVLHVPDRVIGIALHGGLLDAERDTRPIRRYYGRAEIDHLEKPPRRDRFRMGRIAQGGYHRSRQYQRPQALLHDSAQNPPRTRSLASSQQIESLNADLRSAWKRNDSEGDRSPRHWSSSRGGRSRRRNRSDERR